MANLNFKLVLQAVDRITTPVRRIGSSIAAVTSRVSRLGSAGREAGRGVDQMTGRATIAARVADRLASSYHRVSTSLVQMAVVARGRASHALGILGRTAGRTAAGLAVKGAVAISGAWAAAMGALSFGSINTSAEFEGYLTRLKTIEGSLAKAQTSLAWVKKFGKETPYEVADVLDAFIKMRSYGIDPTDGALRSLGDTASGMGKDIMDAVEMLADAQTGEFERLKEFGVKAAVQGNKVSFAYTQNGKDMVKTTDKSAASIRRTLLGIFDAKFKGGMAEMATTWQGMLSNMADWWADFKLRIGAAGVFDLAKGKLKGLLDWLNKAADDGRMQAWAQKIADSIKPVIEYLDHFARSVDWVAVARGVAATAGVFVRLAEAVGKLAEAFERLGRARDNYGRWLDKHGLDFLEDPELLKRVRAEDAAKAAPKLRAPGAPALNGSPWRAGLNGTITLKVDQQGQVRGASSMFDSPGIQTRTERGVFGGGF